MFASVCKQNGHCLLIAAVMPLRIQLLQDFFYYACVCEDEERIKRSNLFLCGIHPQVFNVRNNEGRKGLRKHILYSLVFHDVLKEHVSLQSYHFDDASCFLMTTSLSDGIKGPP